MGDRIAGHASLMRARCYDVVVSEPTKWPTLRTVFLDRDGILNEKMPEGQYVSRWEEFRIIAGVPEALRRLNEAGLRVIVVSNQRGIALGLYSAADVAAIHSKFQQLLGDVGAHIDAFFICPHDKGQCDCRKPLPGLFERAVERFPEISAATSVMIGDSLSDIEFGHRLGMRTVFVEGDRERQKPGADTAAELADLRCASLPEAVNVLLAGE
jgi:D-glycero-D-manno-heptose 1,7-bisphosphate phosphatase